VKPNSLWPDCHLGRQVQPHVKYRKQKQQRLFNIFKKSTFCGLVLYYRDAGADKMQPDKAIDSGGQAAGQRIRQVFLCQPVFIGQT
jgi:hypothetical protein